jgi:hypothetical protein
VEKGSLLPILFMDLGLGGGTIQNICCLGFGIYDWVSLSTGLFAERCGFED